LRCIQTGFAAYRTFSARLAPHVTEPDEQDRGPHVEFLAAPAALHVGDDLGQDARI